MIRAKDQQVHKLVFQCFHKRSEERINFIVTFFNGTVGWIKKYKDRVAIRLCMYCKMSYDIDVFEVVMIQTRLTRIQI